MAPHFLGILALIETRGHPARALDSSELIEDWASAPLLPAPGSSFLPLSRKAKSLKPEVGLKDDFFTLSK